MITFLNCKIHTFVALMSPCTLFIVSYVLVGMWLVAEVKERYYFVSDHVPKFTFNYLI